jgi:hypothetical protein
MKRSFIIALCLWATLASSTATGTAYLNGVKEGTAAAAVTVETITVESTSVQDSTSEYGVMEHDGNELTITTNKGGIQLKTADQKAQGTITLSGQPSAAESFVVNATTITARASGAVADEFNIGGTVPATLANIAAAINAGTEGANCTAWVDSATTVIVEWDTAGTAGNSIVFTEAMTNTTIDGSGTLGATNLGSAANTVADFDHSTSGITLLPNAGGITKIGDAGSTSHSLVDNDDLFISGKSETKGNSYVDGSLTVSGDINAYTWGVTFAGGGDGASIVQKTQDTPDTLKLMPSRLSNGVVMCEVADANTDFAHALETNPTLFIQSADATDITDWISLSHNQTSAVIGSGNGGVQIAARLQGKQGTDVASANDITLGSGATNGGNYFDITGTTEVQRILGTGWLAGSIVVLQFDDSVQVTHGIAAGSSYYGFQLAGASNFSATADDTLMLVFDGAWWREVSRTVI